MTYSEFLKNSKDESLRRFYGESVDITGSAHDNYCWEHFVDDDNIIIVSNNVKYWRNKDQYVLFVDNDKIVYLQYWQVREIKNWDLRVNGYAVKLNRNYFKIYNIHFEQDEFCFDKQDTFDDLVKVAKDQDLRKIYWKSGHYEF